MKPDLVIAVGDVSQWGKPTEFQGLQRIVAELELPFIAIAGNHDCYTLSKAELQPYFLGQYPSVVAEELYTSFEYGGMKFVLLDTAKPREAKDYGGWMTTAQIQWLHTQITDYNQRDDLSHFLLFAHHPLQNTTLGSDEVKLNIENSAELVPVLERLTRTPGYYFCGHNHRHSQVQHKQWHYIQSAAPWDCLSFHWVAIAAEHPSDNPGGTPTPTIEVRHFHWEQDTLKTDWHNAHHSIPHFTPKSWEVANNQ